MRCGGATLRDADLLRRGWIRRLLVAPEAGGRQPEHKETK